MPSGYGDFHRPRRQQYVCETHHVCFERLVRHDEREFPTPRTRPVERIQVGGLERWRHGPTARAQLRAIREIPGHWVVETSEVGTFLLGSLHYRTLVL